MYPEQLRGLAKVNLVGTYSSSHLMDQFKPEKLNNCSRDVDGDICLGVHSALHSLSSLDTSFLSLLGTFIINTTLSFQ